jgi:hypothetical protein
MAGRVANTYAEAVGIMRDRPITPALWLQIGEALMQADGFARVEPTNFEAGSPRLRWDVIQAYRVATFGTLAKLPGPAWTARLLPRRSPGGRPADAQAAYPMHCSGGSRTGTVSPSA